MTYPDAHAPGAVYVVYHPWWGWLSSSGAWMRDLGAARFHACIEDARVAMQAQRVRVSADDFEVLSVLPVWLVGGAS